MGIGFTTFQRFYGDYLNIGMKWTEGFPIEHQPNRGTLENKDYPGTSIAYFRIYWRFIEPEQGVYRWDLIDRAIQTARQPPQTLMGGIASAILPCGKRLRFSRSISVSQRQQRSQTWEMQ
jgi:hypothetical protein